MVLADITGFFWGVLGGIISWVVVPGVLVGIIILAWRLAQLRTDHPAQRTARRVGFWLGTSIFALEVILQQAAVLFPRLNSPTDAFYQGWIMYLSIGVTIGVAIMTMIQWGLLRPFSPFFVGFLSCFALTGFLLYCFVPTYHAPTQLLSLGILIGALFFYACFPNVLKPVFSGNLRARQRNLPVPEQTWRHPQ